MWSSGSIENSANVQITYGYTFPVCACGKPAERTVTNQQTRVQTQACVECAERSVRDGAIARAEAWLNAAFVAVGVAQRARLYKQLAIVFHPDAGGDARLMTALNTVRERFP